VLAESATSISFTSSLSDSPEASRMPPTTRSGTFETWQAAEGIQHENWTVKVSND
jgi:hypothetical protein